MELRRYLTVVWSRWPVLVVLLLVGMLGGWMITPRTTEYTSVGTIYLGNRLLNTQTDLSGDKTIAIAQFGRTAAALIASVPRASEAVQAAGVDRSAEGVVAATTAEVRLGTQLLDVKVKDPDPAVAQKLVDALVDQFVSDVKNLEPDTVDSSEGRVPTVPASVQEHASLPTAPNSNGLIKNLMIGTIVGLLAGVGLVLLFDYLDITVRNADDAENRLELPVLGVIPALGDSLPATPALRAIRTKAKAVR